MKAAIVESLIDKLDSITYPDFEHPIHQCYRELKPQLAQRDLEFAKALIGETLDSIVQASHIPIDIKYRAYIEQISLELRRNFLPAFGIGAGHKLFEALAILPEFSQPVLVEKLSSSHTINSGYRHGALSVALLSEGRGSIQEEVLPQLPKILEKTALHYGGTSFTQDRMPYAREVFAKFDDPGLVAFIASNHAAWVLESNGESL